MDVCNQRRWAHHGERMHNETEAAYAIAAIVCAFVGAAAGVLTRRGMTLTLTAVVLAYAPDWKRGLAWALVAAIWYVIVWLVCTDRRTRREESKIGEQQRSPAVCPDAGSDAIDISIGGG
jgi:type VI protein secretion system component VasK